MSSASRVSSCLLALSLILTGPALAQSQSVPGSSQSSGESAVRAVVENYFARYGAKDIDGMMSLWSEKSPDFASFKQNLQRLFAAEDSSVSDPAISRVKVESEKASLRAMANLTAVNLKSKQKREQRIVRNFAFVREGEQWKVWRSVPAEDDLAAALVKARTEAERTELMAEEKELVTGDLARALTSQGDRFANRREFPQAIIIYALAINLTEQIGNHPEIAVTLHNLGHVQRVQGNFAQAMESFQKSLAMSEALDEQLGIGRALLSLGMVYWSQGDFAQALEHNQKSLTIFEALNNSYAIASLLNNIGNIHRYQGDYKQALDYYLRSLGIQQESNDAYGTMSTLGNIGVVYSSQGNFARALEYYQKSLSLSEAKDDKEGIAITLGNIGVIHRKQGNYEQALDYYQREPGDE